MFRQLFDPKITAEEAGKKAFSLHELHSAGFRVPPGFVIPADQDPAPTELAEAIRSIGGFPVAVRSSANLEDLGGASFAGQYQTYLNVASTEELVEKIRLCRDSASSEQVRAYLRSKGLGHIQPRMTVLIQKMIQSKWAGVAFTIHPLTGKEENALVEFCEGLGEKLVSGHVIPTQYVIHLKSGQIIETYNETGTAPLPVQAVAELAGRLLDVQARFHRPQDIEWAIDDSETLYFLQSRPITRIRFRDDIDEFTNADFKDGGVSARVCTPLMYSLYREVMQKSMPEYFRAIKLIPNRPSQETWIDCFYGRPYWNASAVKRVLLKVPGFDEKDFDQDLGIQKNYGSKGHVRVPFNLRTLIPAIPVAICLEKEFDKALKRVPAFLASFEKQEKVWLERIHRFSSSSDTDFFSQFREVLFDFYFKSENSYFLMIYNNSNAQTELKSFLRRMDAATGGTSEIVKLMGGLNEIVHMDLQTDLISLQKIARAKGIDSEEYRSELRDFVTSHYFHGEAELELMTPRWGEAPEQVTAMISSILKTGTTQIDPVVSAQKQQIEFQAEAKKILERIGRTRLLRMRFKSGFEKQLRRARSFLVEREKMREASAKGYAIARLYILEANRRWRQAEPFLRIFSKERDIFMLHLAEIGALIDAPPDEAEIRELRETIRFRERMFDGYSDFTPPNELGRGLSGDEQVQEAVAGDSQLLRGLGCSPGVREGLVRRIDSLDQMDQIRPGEILVTRFTDPGWTPILGLVQGVVTEVGGMLSHAAVIGREYGIPAVLNLKSATQILATGQKIRVDGTRGTVEILNS